MVSTEAAGRAAPVRVLARHLTLEGDLDLASGTRDPLLDHLVGERAIDAAIAELLQTRLRAAWVPIGKILRRRGHLTMEQLVELLREQEREPHRALGELAVSRGWLGREDLEHALAEQRATPPHALDLLAEAPGVETAVLLRALASYVRTLESRLSGARSGAI